MLTRIDCISPWMSSEPGCNAAFLSLHLEDVLMENCTGPLYGRKGTQICSWHKRGQQGQVLSKRVALHYSTGTCAGKQLQKETWALAKAL